MIAKLKYWFKITQSNNMAHHTDALNILYENCKAFENTYIHELLQCLGYFWFNRKNLMDCISVCGILHKCNKNNPLLKTNDHRQCKMDCKVKKSRIKGNESPYVSKEDNAGSWLEGHCVLWSMIIAIQNIFQFWIRR